MGSLTAELRRTEHRLLTVEEYYRMAEAGILHPEERTELIEGEIIHMAPMNSPHANLCAWLNERLIKLLDASAAVRCKLPVRLNNRSEPEPDILVCKRQSYVQAHPTPHDVHLLIEVADSTYRYDRFVKVPLYASHNIPEVWLIDLSAQAIEVFRQPQGETYKTVEKFDLKAKLSPQAFSTVVVDFSLLK